MNKILYWLKNITFFLYMFGYIYLIPNIYECGFIGILFLNFGIIYILLTYYFFFKKDEKVNYNIPLNLLSIFLYMYVFLISKKYTELTPSNIVNLFYFQVNYIVIIFATFGVCINNFLIQDK